MRRISVASAGLTRARIDEVVVAKADSLLLLPGCSGEKQLQILRLTTPELMKTLGAPFAQDDSISC